MKALGQRAGVSDLLIWAVGARHFAVELKSDRGRLSAAQAAWMDRMAHLGFRVHLCRSLEGLQAILVAEGTPEARNALSGQRRGGKRHSGGEGESAMIQRGRENPETDDFRKDVHCSKLLLEPYRMVLHPSTGHISPISYIRPVDTYKMGDCTPWTAWTRRQEAGSASSLP
jgi:hypothetical protein